MLKCSFVIDKLLSLPADRWGSFESATRCPEARSPPLAICWAAVEQRVPYIGFDGFGASQQKRGWGTAALRDLIRRTICDELGCWFQSRPESQIVSRR